MVSPLTEETSTLSRKVITSSSPNNGSNNSNNNSSSSGSNSSSNSDTYSNSSSGFSVREEIGRSEDEDSAGSTEQAPIAPPFVEKAGTINVAVQVRNSRVILLDDPTTYQSRALAGSCGLITVAYHRCLIIYNQS